MLERITLFYTVNIEIFAHLFLFVLREGRKVLIPAFMFIIT
jgi:hypothetical protein